MLVFVVGAASLGTEIAAARLLAPYFGASTIVWANTIATVLVALSVGYWFGGRLADRSPTRAALCRLVLAASVLLALVPFVARPFLGAAVDAIDSYSAGAFVGSLVGVVALVGVPVALLGAVAPYAIRLSLGHVSESGSVAGGLYALSTVGSLVGTFLAALALVPFAGTQRTFLLFAAVLALVAAPGVRRRALLVPLGIVVVLVAVPTAGKEGGTDGGRVIEEVETPYQYARVVEARDGERELELNEGVAVHSRYRPGTYLTGDYWDEFLVLPFAGRPSPPRRVAMLGNAAGTTARAYGHYFPETAVDAVEIDGELTEIGKRLFDLRGPRLRTYAADARPFLRASDRRYDAIFVDAYRQPYIPFYLATREFFELVRDRLAPGGLVAINVGHPEGDDRLERVLTATMREAFPEVWRDAVADTNTVVLGSTAPVRPAQVAARAPVALGKLGKEVAARLAPGLRGGDVYTDDRAPVEWLIDRSIVTTASDGG